MLNLPAPFNIRGSGKSCELWGPALGLEVSSLIGFGALRVGMYSI